MNKGFTLVELLAVLIIMSFLIVLSVPSYVNIYTGIKRSNYQGKITQINSAAYKYSESIKDEIKNAGCLETNVKELISKGLLISEKESEDVIIDPTTNLAMDKQIRMCYCRDKLDVIVHYVLPFDESANYYVDDIVILDNTLYKCMHNYKNNGGINSTYMGKNYFEKIGC